jgi:hypothetical protein
MNDRDVIRAFVAYLRGNGHPNLEVEGWPENENRVSKEIDAIAGGLAIEHTSIDTLPNQRRDSEWFIQVVGGIERELHSPIPFRLSITLEHQAVTKGQDWFAIRNALKDWINTGSSLLEEGHHVLDGIPGVPFRLYISKASGRRPGLLFGRFDPGDDTLPDRIRELLLRKANKLLKYQCIGKTTVLLVDSEDIALMNESKMLAAVRKSFPAGTPPGVDQVWYADTSIPSEIWFRDFTSALKQGLPTV